VTPPAVGVVLCGGRSRRMGTDKATMLLGGRPLVERPVAALRSAGLDEVMTVGGDPVLLAGAADLHVADLVPGSGPLGGVAAAAAVRPGCTLVVVACDLPDLSPAVVRTLSAAASDGRPAVAVVDGTAQWSVAVLPAAAAAGAARRFGSGARSLREGYGDAVLVEVADAAALADLDSPADVDRWLGPSGAGGSVVRMEKPEIDVDALAGLLQGGPVPLLDVRMPDEYEEAHVPGAVLVPLPELPDRLADVPPGEVVYVICRSGARSAKAVEILVAAGLDAANVAGGTMAWLDTGRDVATGPGPG